MKSLDTSNDSPHQTTAVDGKHQPPSLGEEGENEIHHHASSPFASPVRSQSQEYYPRHQPEEASPSDWGQPYGQQHHHQLAPHYSYDGRGNVVYPNQMQPHPAYHPTHGWHPAPPMLPSMGSMGSYYAPPQAPLHHHHPQAMMYPGAIDSRDSGLSSFSSSSDLDAPGSRQKRRGRRQRRGSRGTSPGSRGWHRYDNNTALYQMKGRIAEIAKDRDGSKWIQRRLQMAEVAEMQVAFDEALPCIEELWNDVYGNYILQGLLELGTDEMREKLGQRIVDGDVVSLSTKVYGCRLIQKALDTLSPDDVANLVATIKGKVWHLVHDHNGNHVIQKSVIKLNEILLRADFEDDVTHELLLSSLDIIVDEVTDGIVKDNMATHPYGCRVVQRLIEHSSGPQKIKILDCVLHEDLFSSLINHEYGNYVVQRVLAYGRTSDKAAVFDIIVGNVLKLSKQKHSSNVVEMMLTYGNAEQRHQMIEEILNCYCVDQNFVSKSAAVSMAEDAYANYVCKTALDVLPEGPQRERMFSILVSSMEELEHSQYAKQVVLRVKTNAHQSCYE